MSRHVTSRYVTLRYVMLRLTPSFFHTSNRSGGSSSNLQLFLATSSDNRETQKRPPDARDSNFTVTLRAATLTHYSYLSLRGFLLAVLI